MIINVRNGESLQAAIDRANYLDEIVLEAGASFTGNYFLRVKGGAARASDYITIRTSDLSNFPLSGKRITSSFPLPKLISPNGTAVLQADDLADHYNILGIETTNVGGNVVTPELILLDGRTNNIIFDRCWIHEATNDTTTPDSINTTSARGFDLNASDISIINSRIAGFRTYLPAGSGDSSPQASNAILFPNAAQRVRIENCYLEAWFAPLFFGGSGGISDNTARLTNISFSTDTKIGSAQFSSISNLQVGDLVAFQVANGRTPSTNSAHQNERVVFQVGKVLALNGNMVTFMAWGSYDGNINSGNPLLQTPCGCDTQDLGQGYISSTFQAQWNGKLNQDIQISRNQFVLNFNSTEEVWVRSGGSPTTLPRSTQVNTGNAPKGFAELKLAKNVTFDGNTFEGWENGFVLTSRNQGNVGSSGGFPWAGLYNIKITNNWWKKMRNWDRIYSQPFGGPQLEDNEYSNIRSGPVIVENNLIESGTGPIFAAMGAADNTVLQHNTYPGGIGGSSMIIGQGAPSSGFIFKDNILPNNEYGLNCQIEGGGCWPNIQQYGNVIIDNRSANGKNGDGPLNGRYPNDSIAPDQNTVGWIDTPGRDYKLSTSSAYKNKASDGTDPGINWDTLVSHLGIDPRDDSPIIAENYNLNVVNGSGSGVYLMGSFVDIHAIIPSGFEFLNWTGDVMEATNPNTTVVVVMQNTTVTAVLRAKRCVLNVVGGTGSGTYDYGTEVQISAEIPVGQEFVSWEIS